MTLSGPELSVVIVNWNGGENLLTCVESVYDAASGRNVEVWLVDNASSDGSADRAAAAHPHLRLIRNESNLGFARAANQALTQTHGEFVLLLNPDAVLDGRPLAAMLQAVRADPKIGIVGCPSVGEDDRWVPAYELSYPGRRGSVVRAERQATSPPVADVAWVSGACLLARRAMIEQVGPLDPDFFMYYEDVDWCYRARQSAWRVVTLPAEAIRHHLGRAARQVPPELTAQRAVASRLRFFRKHYSPARAWWLTVGVVASNLVGWLLWLAPSLFSEKKRQARRLCGAQLAAAIRSRKR